MSRKRLWFGLAVMILVQIVVSSIATSIGARSLADVAMQSVLAFFLAAFAGGLVARHGFLLPALAVWLVLWAAIGLLLYQAVASSVGVRPSIIEHNWVAFLLSGAATCVGAYLSQHLAGRGKGRVAAT